MTTAVSGGVKTILLNHGQVKHLTSISFHTFNQVSRYHKVNKQLHHGNIS